ncbi:MAG: hypothetical protein A2148_08570 [Chloroflexi bacterium RBG_16_68_14]|nr:MAG: hypothetical protein A2148_08570 [Chloroflexi bacterium RBG_16_68_14]
MGHRLTIGSGMWETLRSHLLADRHEHLAFLLAGYTAVGGHQVLLACELVLIPDDDLEGSEYSCGLSLKLEALLHVMNRANRAGLALVEAHSHPFSTERVAFSPTDSEGQSEMVAYIADTLPGRPYGALVLGQQAVEGQVWLPGSARPEQLDEVRVVGDNMARIFAGGTARSYPRQVKARPLVSDCPYHRQVLAIGEEGHARLRSTRVAVVGLGGVGSVVAQQLAHLGVRQFVLVDDDHVERTNLHRLVGAVASDAGTAKVEVARRQIKAVNPTADVTLIPSSARTAEALDALRGMDVLCGCVDTDAGRLILNELALAYLIPYIDCGVGIVAGREGLEEAGGKVSVWTPGRPCLMCTKDINPCIAAEELETQQEQEFRRLHGYVAGAHVPEPAVISLNSTVASLAVTELLALVTGVRPSLHYTYYDLLEGRSGARLCNADDRCTACALFALGDKADVIRYSRAGLPSDLPALEQNR